jgi:hypothetical protein
MDQDVHFIVNDYERGGGSTRNGLIMSYSSSSSFSSSKVLALFGVPVSAKFVFRNFKQLGLTNLSRTSTRTINGLPISGSRDNS